MIGDTLYFIEFRTFEGTVMPSISGIDFMPNTPADEWPTFRSIGEDKNQVIDAIIAKLYSLKS